MHQPEVDLTFNPRKTQGGSPAWEPDADSLGHQVTVINQRIQEVTAKRDELLCRWRDVQREAMEKGANGKVLVTSLDVEQLRAQSRKNEVELENLRQELRTQYEREQGSEQQQSLRRTVGELYEELDEIQRVREDERVRSESEVRELRSERDTVRDRVSDAQAELQRLLTQTDALRALRAETGGDGAVSTEELDSLRAENEQRANELERLKGCEDAFHRTIRDLEAEQEALVEKISLKAAQAVPFAEGSGPEQYAKALEMKALELSGQLQQVETSCREREAEVAHLRQSAWEAQATAEELRRQCDELRQQADERSTQSPGVPVASFSSGSTAATASPA